MSAPDTDTAVALRRWAKGMYTTEAAAELLIRAFGGRFARPGNPWIQRDGDAIWLDVDQITDDTIGALSGGERRLMLLVAALVTTRPIDLGRDRLRAGQEQPRTRARCDRPRRRQPRAQPAPVGRQRAARGFPHPGHALPVAGGLMVIQGGSFNDPAELPTFEQIRVEAYRLLGDVEDILRSDWRPGAGPLKGAGAHLADARRRVAQAKAALDEAARG